MSNIPSELVDHIIDHLHDDRTSLSVCTVISRTWHHAARYHLFYSISVCNSAPSRCFTDFMRFLDATSSIIGLIRQLSLLGRHNTDKVTSPPCIGTDFLVFLLEKLDALHTLVLDDVSLDANICTTIGSVGKNVRYCSPIPRTLHSLQLRQIQIYDSTGREVGSHKHGTLEILRLFSNLDELKLYKLRLDSWAFDDADASLDLPLDLRIGSLSVDNCSAMKTFLEALRKTDTLNSLHSLHLQSSGVSDAYSYRTFIREAAPNLRNFTLDMVDSRRPFFLDPRTLQNTYNAAMSSCPNLLSIHLRFLVDHGGRHLSDNYRSGWPYLTALLPVIQPAPRSLTITLVTPPPLDAEEDNIMELAQKANWKDIEEGLRRLNHMGLEKALFVIEDMDDSSPNACLRTRMWRFIEEKLFLLKSSGILSLQDPFSIAGL